MPRNVYSEIHLHVTWHTLNNAPTLVDMVETRTHRHLRHRALKTEGVIVHEIGGVEDHVHLVVSIPPTIPISEWIGQLKGGSSHYINSEICNRKVLDWQTGYGVVSFGTKDLPWAIDYVRRQKEHHAKGTTQPRLERVERDEPGDGKPVETG